jgi:hypothetical protein
MIHERKEEPKPEPSDLNLEIWYGIGTGAIPIYFSKWNPDVLIQILKVTQHCIRWVPHLAGYNSPFWFQLLKTKSKSSLIFGTRFGTGTKFEVFEESEPTWNWDPSFQELKSRFLEEKCCLKKQGLEPGANWKVIMGFGLGYIESGLIMNWSQNQNGDFDFLKN